MSESLKTEADDAASRNRARLKSVIASSSLVVHPASFLMAKVRGPITCEPVFVARDGEETSVVATEDQVSELDAVAIEGPFRLFEFRISTPFETPGFLAAIAAALAEANINVLIFSTYSKDFVMVRSEDAESAIARLRTIGFALAS